MQQLIVLGALSLAFHWVAQFYCDNRLHSEFCTPLVCTCQIVWAQARKHACTFWAGRVCFPCVFANLCALDVSACARAGWGEREREVQDAMCSKKSLSTSCHVGARSVCSCLRQMTCPAPQGPPVILHPLSPTDPTDGPAPRAYFLFVCV